MLPRFAHYIIIALAALALAGCKEKPPTSLQGYVEGEYLYLAPLTAGYLESLSVEQGDEVTSGKVLFAMDATREKAALAEAEQKLQQAEALLEDARLGKRPTEIAALEAQLRQNQAALELAAKVSARQQKLSEDKLIPTEELDRARADAQQKQQAVNQLKSDLATADLGQRTHQVQAAESNMRAVEASVKQARWNLEQTTQTAPATGQIFDTYFRPGEMVGAGKPVVSLLPPERVRVRVFVSEGQRAAVKAGSRATVRADGLADTLTGSVSFISPHLEYTPPVIYSREMRQKLATMVEISFPPESARRLSPGQPVEVNIEGVVP